jgi:cytosine/adenosine deaminase-related metal-dependent hydrolase
MGWSDKVGSLEAGKWADVIAVQGDPLSDVKLLQHVPFVMRSGIVFKDEAHPAAVDKLVAAAPSTPNTIGTENSF